MTQTQVSRRKSLEAFLNSNPADAFARYGLALECAKEGDAEAALNHFRDLLSAHPDYVAGYFQCGQFLARLGRIAEAKQVLIAGIAAAEHSGDQHAREEMQALVDSLG